MLALKFPTVFLLETLAAFPYISKLIYGFLNIGLKLYIFQTIDMLNKLIICYITCRPLVKLTGHHELETCFTLMGLVMFGKIKMSKMKTFYTHVFSKTEGSVFTSMVGKYS